jgi:AcrR family transcriptional regulator
MAGEVRGVSAAKRPRRTQEERSATTRALLLDATIDCLIEFGYANTTTARVAERAGVSRGAQVHHFTTKTALMAEAIRHLAVKRGDALIYDVDGVKNSPDRINTALDLLWEAHTGPMLQATFELWSAARTDPELRASLLTVESQVARTMFEAGRALFGEHALAPNFDANLHVALATMRGLAIIEHLAAEPDVAPLVRWDRTRQRLHALISGVETEREPKRRTTSD